MASAVALPGPEVPTAPSRAAGLTAVVLPGGVLERVVSSRTRMHGLHTPLPWAWKEKAAASPVTRVSASG